MSPFSCAFRPCACTGRRRNTAFAVAVLFAMARLVRVWVGAAHDERCAADARRAVVVSPAVNVHVSVAVVNLAGLWVLHTHG